MDELAAKPNTNGNDEEGALPNLTLIEAKLAQDRERLEAFLVSRGVHDPHARALWAKLALAKSSGAIDSNELGRGLWALSAVLVNLDMNNPFPRTHDVLAPLRRLHNAVQDYSAGAIASLNSMRGTAPNNRTNAAAPSEARERAAIAWCVHRLALGGHVNGAFSVNEAAREVSRYLTRLGLRRTFLAVRTIYYAVRRGKDTEAAGWFKVIEAEPVTNPPAAVRSSKADRLAWLSGVTFFGRQ